MILADNLRIHASPRFDGSQEESWVITHPRRGSSTSSRGLETVTRLEAAAEARQQTEFGVKRHTSTAQTSTPQPLETCFTVIYILSSSRYPTTSSVLVQRFPLSSIGLVANGKLAMHCKSTTQLSALHHTLRFRPKTTTNYAPQIYRPQPAMYPS
jgi:hypothetical protein